MKYLFLFFCTLLVLHSCTIHPLKENKTKSPNILFIAIDDLRPELGCYGNTMAITPHIDALASEGILFENAYCQQAICSPSRASLMTGARPETINVIENFTDFREENPSIITLPQQLRENGFETINCGKVYHGKYNDKEKSWSKFPDHSLLPYEYERLIGGYALKENQELFLKNKKVMTDKYGPEVKYGLGMGPAFESAEVEDHIYLDGMNTDLAIVNLRKMLKEQESKPFFMGLGYVSPHLNFTAPNISKRCN